MDDQTGKGVERGSLPDGSSEGSPISGKESSRFIQNNLEHFVFPAKKFLAIILGLPLGGAFLIGVRAYQYGIAQIDDRVYEEAINAAYDKHTTIGDKLHAHNEQLTILQNQADRVEKSQNTDHAKIEDITGWIKSRGGKIK